jgi:hypothetical protein
MTEVVHFYQRLHVKIVKKKMPQRHDIMQALSSCSMTTRKSGLTNNPSGNRLEHAGLYRVHILYVPWLKTQNHRNPTSGRNEEKTVLPTQELLWTVHTVQSAREMRPRIIPGFNDHWCGNRRDPRRWRPTAATPYCSWASLNQILTALNVNR